MEAWENEILMDLRLVDHFMEVVKHFLLQVVLVIVEKWNHEKVSPHIQNRFLHMEVDKYVTMFK